MDLSSEEFRRGFLAEAGNIIEQFEQLLLQLEKDSSGSDEVLNELFRHAHNLKGSSQLVGYQEFSVLAHRVEDVLFVLKNKTVALTSGAISLLLKCLDRFASMKNGLNADLDAHFTNDDLLTELEKLKMGKLALAAHPTHEVPPQPVAPAEVFPLDSMTSSTLAAESKSADLSEFVVPSADNPLFASVEASSKNSEPELIPAAPIAAKVEPQNAPSSSRSKEAESVRVPMAKIEALNNLVGELVILHTVLDQQRIAVSDAGMAKKTTAQLGKLSKEIQDISMSFRMMPLKSTFQKMSRIVRDTSQLLGKRVSLVLEGEDKEIDKALVDGLYDPLVHLIRNAIDHGLESPETRKSKGKPEEGVVHLKAFHEGNKICIQIDDDGQGIDPSRILAKAVEKRLVRDPKSLSPAEIINLVFLPGFSTKEAVSDVSGRGVGMDVVKTNITAMGGEVQISSETGKGSSIKILLPLTTAIIDAMIVSSGGSKYVVPLSQVHESIRPRPDQVHHVSGVGDCLHLRGEVMVLCDFAKTLGLMSTATASNERIAIIVRSTKRAFAVLVDDILQQQQVVIRKLGRELRYPPGIVGSSILGDGRPSFILDLVEMFAAAAGVKRTAS